MSDPKTDPSLQRFLRLLRNVLLALFCIALLIPVGYIGLFFLLILFSIVPVNMIPGTAGLVIALLLLALTIIPFKGRWRVVLRRIAGVGALVSLAVLAGTWGWNAYQKSITIVDNTNIDTSLYLPFDEDSQIARLEGEASLRFTLLDDLPVVDGAAALFPVYSAMVNATYPRNILPLNQEGSPFTYHNTVGGYKLLAEGKTDILFAAAPNEDQLASFAPVEFELIPVGREGFIFFTNAANPVDSLTQDQLRGIYSGTITNWSQVGGRDTPILPYQRNRGSGSQTGLENFMGDVPLADPPTELRNDLMSGIIERVADYHNNPGAIGFSYYIYASQLQANHNIKLLAVDGVTPSQETIGQGSYPLTDSFYMVVRKGERTEEMDRFLTWALSEEGQALVAGSGYAPVNEKSGKADCEGAWTEATAK